MCYVRNQWYDISCATLYMYISLYIYTKLAFVLTADERIYRIRKGFINGYPEDFCF